MNIFFERYTSLCKEVGSSPNGIAKILAIPSSSVTNWKHGHNPNIETVKMIAEYFGVSVDWLLGNCDSKFTSQAKGELLSDYEMELLAGFRKLNAIGQKEVLKHLRYVLSDTDNLTGDNTVRAV